MTPEQKSRDSVGRFIKGSARDLTGQKFNRLTPIKIHEIKDKRVKWLCLCDCGKETITYASSITTGHVKSCGCYNRDRIKQKKDTLVKLNKAEHMAWWGAKMRCYNPGDSNYNNYGGRGIKMCDRWLDSFENFLNDMGKRPTKNHSIDRSDNNGNYEPSNCKWATQYEQRRNQRKNIFVEYKGNRMVVGDFAKAVGLKNFPQMYAMVKNGYNADQIVNYYKNHHKYGRLVKV